MNLEEYEPFKMYPETPCYVLFEGEPAIYAPTLSYKPIKIKETEIERIK
jgi:hypothetical protein